MTTLTFPALPPLGLYIHMPWCVQKCPYCDFNSHALREDLPARRYVDVLLEDLAAQVASIKDREIGSIFFGGGTPSLFPPDEIARLLAGIRSRVALAEAAEITLEANPGTVEQSRFEGFGAAGVNRLSLGIQSFAADKLTRLGRIHGPEEALRAARAARAAGFDNYNLDLMFGLPGQSLAEAFADIDTAVDLNPSHISHYQLTLEPNTLFHARPPELPDEDLIFAMQTGCQERLGAAGFRQYEVSAYSRADTRCRHNLNYWQFGDYLGIGAGAHGKLTDSANGTIRRFMRHKHPRSYMDAPTAVADERVLDTADIALEFLMNALRLNDGFEIELCQARTGLSWNEQFADRVAANVDAGLLETDGATVRTTDKGRLFLDELLQRFL